MEISCHMVSQKLVSGAGLSPTFQLGMGCLEGGWGKLGFFSVLSLFLPQLKKRLI